MFVYLYVIRPTSGSLYDTANLRTTIMDFRGFDSSITIIMSIGDFPGNVESSNLSRDNLSREIGRTACIQDEANVGQL